MLLGVQENAGRDLAFGIWKTTLCYLDLKKGPHTHDGLGFVAIGWSCLLAPVTANRMV